MNGARCINGRATNGLTYRKQTTREASSDSHMQTAVTRAWKGECNRLLPTWQLIQLFQCMVVPMCTAVSSDSLLA